MSRSTFHRHASIRNQEQANVNISHSQGVVLGSTLPEQLFGDDEEDIGGQDVEMDIDGTGGGSVDSGDELLQKSDSEV